jgi:hypothetical protein
MPVQFNLRRTSSGPMQLRCYLYSVEVWGGQFCVPGSGTGTISTFNSKSGPSLYTTPALHSLGISKVVLLIFRIEYFPFDKLDFG